MIYHSKQSGRKFLQIGTVAILCLCLTSNLAADTDDEQFLRGKDYYYAGEYEAAIRAFTEATATAPEISAYHHWLGRSYGQLAKNSGLLRAYSLSRKTREALEHAVELDNENTEAMTDLIKYYEQAPSFLGGGQEKAEKLRNRLEELENRTAYTGS
jgi:tetratricopeptide (TPR) repeat protein